MRTIWELKKQQVENDMLDRQLYIEVFIEEFMQWLKYQHITRFKRGVHIGKRILFDFCQKRGYIYHDVMQRYPQVWEQLYPMINQWLKIHKYFIRK